MNDGARRRVTLADVAREIGVSKATVSKALNGRDDIAPQTRERILAAVAELQYRPSTAPALRRSLAIVFDLPASPYILGLLQGALAEATRADIDLVTRLAPPLADRTQRAAAREWVARQRAAGIVGIVALTISRPNALLEAAKEATLPFVVVDPIDTAHRGMVSVASSNWAGARAAAEHLLALGHTRIAWIGGPETSDAATDRRHGYQAALDSAAIPIDPALIRTGQFTVADGAAHARELLDRPDRPTAIMAADDEIAVGVLATAHELGIAVPAELSVTGFDDTPQAAWTTPPLTTVHQDLEGMGSMAVQTTLVMAEGRRPSSPRVELATSLTVRDSTAPAPR